MGIIDCINLKDVILAEATVKHFIEGVEKENHLNDKSSFVLRDKINTSDGELSSTICMKSTKSLK